MSVKSRWSTIEGGITNTFPLSINRTTYWTALRKGECFAQDMARRDQKGILTYSPAPEASEGCFVKDFAPGETVFHYGRAWSLSGTELVYGGIAPGSAREGAINFNDDGNDPIRLVAFTGDGLIYVVKNNAGYTVTDANLGPRQFRKSSPFYGIGTDYEGVGYTNALIKDSLPLIFRGGHYLWAGKGETAELSESIRRLVEEEQETPTAPKAALVYWPEQLLLFGRVCYDMKERKVFYFSGANSCSVITRPYYTPQYNPVTISRMCFICDGNSGSFDAVIEYGQSVDKLSKTKTFKVNITQNSKQRFRHVWILDLPVVCRVWRLRIENLVGCGITQIDVDSSASDSPDTADGTE